MNRERLIVCLESQTQSSVKRTQHLKTHVGHLVRGSEKPICAPAQWPEPERSPKSANFYLDTIKTIEKIIFHNNTQKEKKKLRTRNRKVKMN